MGLVHPRLVGVEHRRLEAVLRGEQRCAQSGGAAADDRDVWHSRCDHGRRDKKFRRRTRASRAPDSHARRRDPDGLASAGTPVRTATCQVSPAVTSSSSRWTPRFPRRLRTRIRSRPAHRPACGTCLPAGSDRARCPRLARLRLFGVGSRGLARFIRQRRLGEVDRDTFVGLVVVPRVSRYFVTEGGFHARLLAVRREPNRVFAGSRHRVPIGVGRHPARIRLGPVRETVSLACTVASSATVFILLSAPDRPPSSGTGSSRVVDPPPFDRRCRSPIPISVVPIATRIARARVPVDDRAARTSIAQPAKTATEPFRTARISIGTGRIAWGRPFCSALLSPSVRGEGSDRVGVIVFLWC